MAPEMWAKTLYIFSLCWLIFPRIQMKFFCIVYITVNMHFRLGMIVVLWEKIPETVSLCKNNREFLLKYFQDGGPNDDMTS